MREQAVGRGDHGKEGAMPSSKEPIESLLAHLRAAHPELETVREAAAKPVYLVGGAVRDLLLGRDRADLDLVVEGDAAALAESLGAAAVEHERFATAKVELDGHEVDIASARSETYSYPGALPDVAVAADLEADLGRRDFTVNAMAIPLGGGPRLLDPFDGRSDLEAGQLRVLHRDSFVDDPTRAIRAARYAARFGFELEAETGKLLRATDLATVSADRRDAELLRLAGEPTAPRALALLCEWGLLEPRDGGIDLATGVDELLGSAPWRELVPREQALLKAALGPIGGEGSLAAAHPARPSQAVELARRRDPVELALARTLGAEWLDEYVGKWRAVELEIDGGDLIAAGVPEGPALGRGLAAALRAKLDGEANGRDQELAVALGAAEEA
jgi:tRNA nucleotidyltransferase (CCA-adding enzyme)